MSSKLCNFEPWKGVFRCSECGVRRKQIVFRACDSAKPGDALESFLASHGITKEWYTDFKTKFGLPPTCDCDARQKWLNETAAAHPTIANIGVKFLAAITRKK